MSEQNLLVSAGSVPAGNVPAPNTYRTGAPYNKRTGRERVINMFPRYRPDQVEDYGRAKLMLHHSFRNVDDLKFICGIHDRPCATFADAWAIAIELSEYPLDENDGLDDPLPEPESTMHEGTPEDDGSEGASDVDEDWEVLARQLPARDGAGLDTSQQLGKRPFDLQFSWDDKIGTHPNLDTTWWKITKVENPVDFHVDGAMVTAYNDIESNRSSFMVR
jgi:hypothetical protein